MWIYVLVVYFVKIEDFKNMRMLVSIPLNVEAKAWDCQQGKKYLKVNL